MIEILINSILDPDDYMILGGTYETPVNEGLLDEDFVEQLRLTGTFNEDSFERELIQALYKSFKLRETPKALITKLL